MKKSTRAVLLGTFLILQSVIFVTQNQIAPAAMQPHHVNSRILAYTPHAAMNITSNAGFASQGWNGSGIENDPYSISGWSFDSIYSLGIANTTAYFSIENCHFISGTVSQGSAINLDNVTNANIESCLFEKMYYAISVDYVNDTIIHDNIIENVGYGITGWLIDNLEFSSNIVHNVTWATQLGYCSNSLISSNIIYDCAWVGIDIYGRNVGTRITDNEIYDVADDFGDFGGIVIDGSGIIIEGNTVYDTTRGIGSGYWGDTHDCIVRNNEVYDCIQGFQFSIAENITFEDNTVHDVLAGFSLSQCDNLNLTSNNIGSSFEGIGLYSNLHCIVVDNILTHGTLRIDGFAPSHFRHQISGNTIDGEPIGYLLDKENMEIKDQQYRQLFLVNCINVIIRNQELHNAFTGISLAYSTDSQIINSTIHGNLCWGVDVLYGEHCTISDCIIYNNGYIGYQNAISLRFSNATSILNCKIYKNNGTGIEIMHSSHTFVYNNLITNNTAYGIQVASGSSDNRIYGNAIGWNHDGNAHDKGDDTAWDDGNSLGNWWSDYHSADSEVYEVEGGEGQDNYPREFTSWTLALPLSTGAFGLEILILVAGIVGITIVVILLLLKKKGAL